MSLSEQLMLLQKVLQKKIFGYRAPKNYWMRAVCFVSKKSPTVKWYVSMGRDLRDGYWIGTYSSPGELIGLDKVIRDIEAGELVSKAPGEWEFRGKNYRIEVLVCE